MPTIIDDRVVRMSFDNRGFEHGVRETLSSLERLKSALSFNKSSSNLDLSGISAGVDQLNKKFSALGIAGMTVMQDITRSAEQMGKRLVDAVSLNAIKDGFREYELQMDSVKTIMASTGSDIGTVNKYLDELNEYADQTIYSFSDMTNNIGKFTNAGIKLEDAVMAIKGIANEAAVSGANANEASRAMYNFSQALSGGSVKLRDWMSIENANMATAEFKQQLIDAGVELGTLAKKSDGTYEVLTTNMNGTKMKETITNVQNFRDSLQYSWMTTEVLTKTLKNYADETTEIGKKAKEAAQDVTTFSKLIDTLKEALGSSWNKTFQLIFGDFEEAKKFWTEISKTIGSVIDSFGDARNAMLKIWHDDGGRDAMIDSLRNTWNGLSEVMNVVGESFRNVFPPMTGEKIIEFTKRLKELTAQFKLNTVQTEVLRDIFTGVFSALKIGVRVIESIADSVKELFSILKPFLIVFSLILSSLGRYITNIAKADDMLKYAIDNVGTLFDDIHGIIYDWSTDISEVFDKIFGVIQKNINTVKEKISSLFGSFKKDDDIQKATKNTNKFVTAIESLESKIKKLLGLEKDGSNGIVKATKDTNKFVTAIESLQSKFEHLFDFSKGDGKSPFSKISSDIDNNIPIVSKFQDKLDKLKKTFDAFKNNGLSGSKKNISDLGESFKKSSKLLDLFFGKSKSGSSDAGSNLQKSSKQLDIFREKLASFSDFFNTIPSKIAKGIKQITSTISANMPKIIKYFAGDNFGDLLDNVTKLFAIGWYKNINDLIKARRKGVEQTFGSLTKIFKTVDKGAANLSKTISKVGDNVSKFFDNLSKSGGKKTSPLKDGSISTNLLKLAGAIAVFTGSVIALAKIKPDKLAVAIGVISAEFTLLFKAFDKIQKLADRMSNNTALKNFGTFHTMTKIITQFIKLGAAIKVISTSVKNLGELNRGDLIAGVLGLYAIVELLLHTIKKLVSINDNSSYGLVSIKAISKGIITFALGIRLLATSVKALGTMDTVQMLQGLAGVLVLLEAINLFTQEAKQYEITLKSAAALVLTIEAIKMMTSAAVSLAGLNFGSFAQGLVGVLVLLEAINLFTKEAKSYDINLKSALALVLTIETIKMMTSAAVSLAGLDFYKYAQGLIGILVFLEAINLFTQEVKKYNIDLKSALALIITIEAIKMMTSAALDLAGLEFNKYAQGLVGVLVFLEAINLFLNEAKNTELNLQSLAGLIISAGIVKEMSKIIIELSALTWVQVAQGTASIFGTLLAFALFIKELSSIKVNPTELYALVGVAGSLLTVSKAIATLGELEPDKLQNSVLAFGAIILGLLATVSVLSKVQNSIIEGAGALVIMALAMLVLTPALKSLGSLEMVQVAAMLISLAGSLIILTVAGNELGKNAGDIAKGGAALIVLAAALLILAPALKILSSMDMEQSAFMIMTLAGSLIVLGVAGYAIGNSALKIAAGGAALIVLATAIFILAPALRILGSMDSGQIVGMLVSLAGALTVLGVAGAAFGAAAEIIGAGAVALLAFGGAIALLGAGLLAIGYSLPILGIGLKEFADRVNQVAANITEDVAKTAAALGKLASEFVVNLFSNIANAIVQGLPKIAQFLIDAFVGLINTIADTIRREGPRILGAFANLLESLIELAITAIQTLFNIIAPGPIADFINGGLDKAKMLFREHLAPHEMKQIGEDAMGQNGLAGGIQAQESTVNNATSGVGSGILGTLGNMISGGKSFNIGSLFGGNLSKGMLSTRGLLGNSANVLGNTVLGNLNIDTTNQGYLYGTDLASGINLAQPDVTQATQGLTGNITDEFNNVNVDFEKLGNENVQAYIDPFDSNSTQNVVKKSGSDLATEGVSGAKSKRGEFVNAGKDSGIGFGDGLDANDVKKYVENKSSGLANVALNGLRKTMDSHSPSREAEKIGVFGGEGFALGLANMASVVKDKASNLGQSALDGMRLALANLSDMANADMVTDPMIRPVLDLSEIQNGIGTMNGMFNSPMIGLRASLAGTGNTVQDLYNIAGSLKSTGSNNDNVVGEMIALRQDVKNLGQAMSQMRIDMDGREVGGIVSKEVDRRLGIRYLRNRREGRA